MSKYKIIAICGKSASGKDSLLREVVRKDSNFHEIVSCTTRPPRELEVDGVNYFFMSEEEFLNKKNNNEMLETSSFRDWFYGTSLEGVSEEKINVGVFNPTGINSLLSDSRVDIYLVLVEASDKVRLIRSLHREANPDVGEIIRRYQTDNEDFANFHCGWDYRFDSTGASWSDLDHAALEIAFYAQRHWAGEAN